MLASVEVEVILPAMNSLPWMDNTEPGVVVEMPIFPLVRISNACVAPLDIVKVWFEVPMFTPASHVPLAPLAILNARNPISASPFADELIAFICP